MVPAPSYVQTPASQARPLAGGNAFEDARVMRTRGLHWDWLERGPDSRIFSQAFMLLRRSGTIVAFAGVKNLSALPIGTQPRKHPEISHGGCHMVARKNGLSEGSDKPLI